MATGCCPEGAARLAPRPAPADESHAPDVRPAGSEITLDHRWDHFLARWGWRRHNHRVTPGIYSFGRPTPASPVFVTANYTLSFDALRSSLAGMDAWILVLDTQGINVWCAAGSKKFSTEELVSKMVATGLARVVSHRKLILPQLSASGVAARRVGRETGFAVEFGPIRAGDIPEYLRLGSATPRMRRATFGLWERIILIPMELVHAVPYLAGACLLLFLAGGWIAAAAGAAAFIAGTVLFPILLPWLPTREFSTKGIILGVLAAIPFALLPFRSGPGLPWWLRAGLALTALLAMPPVTAYLALNFTGATPHTSRSGVRREILTYLPAMAWMLGSGLVLGILLVTAKIVGGI